MSLQSQLTLAFQSVAAQFNAIKALRGDLTTLTTTDKASLVGAINEVAGTAGSAAVINDSASSATTTYSSDKITTDINTAVSNLVDSAPAALDTLNELATAITGNDADITNILTAQGNRVAVDQVQSFTSPQQLQARTNIDAQSATDIGDTAHDFVADFTGALT